MPRILSDAAHPGRTGTLTVAPRYAGKMPRRPTPLAYAALASVCFFWGTTYLGIRISTESVTPAVAVAVRYLLSGSILLIAALARGAHIPRGRELRVACICGVLIHGLGNGSVFYAEQLIPSGLASLFITISPFWLVGLEALMGGERLHLPTIGGMLVGLAGAALLLLPSGGTFDRSTLVGFLIIQASMIGWTFGSLYQRRQTSQAHPIVTGAVQQLAAGIVFIPIALASGGFHAAPTSRSMFAIAYLVVFGSIVGYSSYIFAMDRLPVAVVSIYPYVNAVVAVFLGWLVFREPAGPREIAAMLIIFLGVGIVKRTARGG